MQLMPWYSEKTFVKSYCYLSTGERSGVSSIFDVRLLNTFWEESHHLRRLVTVGDWCNKGLNYFTELGQVLMTNEAVVSLGVQKNSRD